MPSLDAATRLEAALRRRLAGDLHDDPLQALAAVAMGLELMRMQRGEDTELTEIEEIARDATKRLRRMLAEITGPEEDLPLAEALESHVADLGAQCTIQLDVEPPAELRSVVAQLAAAAAAGGATSVSVGLRESLVTVSVTGAREDEFDLASARAQLAGGDCTRDGDSLEIAIPLP